MTIDWMTVALAQVPAIGGGLVMWGQMRTDIRHNQREIERVEAQVLTRLTRIEDKLDRLVEHQNPS